MYYISDPKQGVLFDSFHAITTPKTRKRLLQGWVGVFRHIILELLPVDVISGHFNPSLGRPTKELYSMAGLILLQEFRNWTKDEAVEAYCYYTNVQYALNLEPITHELSKRTLERYIGYFKNDGLAKSIMDEITCSLIELCGIKISQQRLDSTHIFSDMASFGRTRLMGVTIKRFLTQLKKHDLAAYESLEAPLRARYAPDTNHLFGDIKKGNEQFQKLRLQVAQDMYMLTKQFLDDGNHNNRTTYKNLVCIFYQQCEVEEDKVSIIPLTGGDVMQNPSDPDATYDGHKGSGYQVQLSETCHKDNDVQLITCAIAQTAVDSDSQAIEGVLAHLTASNLLPEELLADTAYNSDSNIEYAQAKGVDLIGPVQGASNKTDCNALTIDDFNVDDKTEEVQYCPEGNQPLSSKHNNATGKTKTNMPATACSQCDYCNRCPVNKVSAGYQLEHTAKERRIAGRRCEMKTDVFKERYKPRGGIEGTNSCLKRKMGLGKLRVRGRPSVYHAIYLKIAGWNILRASVCSKIIEIVYARAYMAILEVYMIIFLFINATKRLCRPYIQTIRQIAWV